MNTSHASCMQGCASWGAGQDILEDFEKWRNGGLIEKIKAAVEEANKESLPLRFGLTFVIDWGFAGLSLQVLLSRCVSHQVPPRRMEQRKPLSRKRYAHPRGINPAPPQLDLCMLATFFAMYFL